MRKRTTPPRGFTLVEVLVVIAIIGLLVALLLPAIQAAREAARRTQCQNNLKQIGLAVQTCHDSQRSYPLGRERTDQLSASWAFRLLPFMEEETLFKSRVLGQTAASDVNSTAMRTPIPMFYCPSRRPPAADRDFTNGYQPPVLQAAAAGGDYAANVGCSSLEYGADTNYNPLPKIDPTVAGPILTYFRVSVRHVTDGLSKTLAIGERFLPFPATNQPPAMVQVLQGDTAFFCGDIPETIFRSTQEGFPSGRDDPQNTKFGSDHGGDLCHFVMLDGHVQPLQYGIAVRIFQQLSAIGDGGIVPGDPL